MTLDNVLIAQILTILNNGFASISSQVPTAPVIVQSYQPAQQGAITAPALYLYKIGDTLLGSPARKDVWDSVNNIEVHTEIQQYETQFQLSAWVTQNPNGTTQLTASDYANFAAAIMKSSPTIATLEAQGMGIYRIGAVRNPPIMDDRERFEFAPSFDFTITHKQIFTTDVPIITETILQVIEV